MHINKIKRIKKEEKRKELKETLKDLSYEIIYAKIEGKDTSDLYERYFMIEKELEEL